MLNVTPTGAACGASITGVDLSQDLTPETIQAIRAAWLEHHVLAFPGQSLTDADLIRFTNYFGSVGDDPFFVPISEDNQVVALTRKAEETAPVFAESWHTDWSFKSAPPIGTCLYSLTVPPVGGDTGFINQQQALKDMPQQLRTRLEDRLAKHSAAVAYAPDGLYGARDESSDRTMQIITDESANEVRTHPFISPHPESGNETLFGTLGYITGIEGMPDAEAQALIYELYEWQTRPEFQYTHHWQENMLVMWDNRSVLHKANGGYDGYDREMHRTTIAGEQGLAIN